MTTSINLNGVMEKASYSLGPRALPHMILDYLFNHTTRWADGSRPFEDWHSVTKQGLVDHILEDLNNPHLTLEQGVQLYDIKAAKYRGVKLDKVVSFIYDRLENPLADIGTQIVIKQDGKTEDVPIGVDEYNAILVKTLRCSEQEGLGTVDWKRVEGAYPDASAVEFDPKKDSKDLFSKTFSPSFVRRAVDLYNRWKHPGFVFRLRA